MTKFANHDKLGKLSYMYIELITNAFLKPILVN